MRTDGSKVPVNPQDLLIQMNYCLKGLIDPYDLKNQRT